MSRPKLEVADIFRDHGAAWRQANAGHVSLEQLKVMTAIERCRTAALGGHVERCENCAHTVIAYNSCRNRHCPKCYAKATAGEQETLRQLSDRELLIKAARELAILSIHVSRGLQKQMSAIFEQRSKAAELAVIIRAISACFKVVAAVLTLRTELGSHGSKLVRSCRSSSPPQVVLNRCRARGQMDGKARLARAHEARAPQPPGEALCSSSKTSPV